jgi:c-di-GMP-binding flagellar brake protein YcgR
MQRRSFYRVNVPHGTAGFCALIVQNGKRINLAIQNISVGGVCLYGCDPLIAALQPRQTVRQVIFSLGDYLQFETDIFIIDKTVRLEQGKGEVTNLHIRFENLPPRQEVALQRSIYQLEMSVRYPGVAEKPRVVILKR